MLSVLLPELAHTAGIMPKTSIPDNSDPIGFYATIAALDRRCAVVHTPFATCEAGVT